MGRSMERRGEPSLPRKRSLNPCTVGITPAAAFKSIRAYLKQIGGEE